MRSRITLMRIRIFLSTLMQILIRKDIDADPDPAFQSSAIPRPGPASRHYADPMLIRI
jgi:hypothetical protein